jgi:hypothetical protein
VTTNAKSKALKTKLENSSTNKHHGLASPHGEHRRAWHSRPRLLNYAESLKAIPWQTDNNWIVNGYRPQLLNVRACLWSAIGCE